VKNYSLLIKHVVCGALVCCVFGLSQSPSYGQGRSLTKQQIDTIVKPNLAQCSAPSVQPANGQTKNARLDPYSIIPTSNAREFSVERVAKTLHGMWRGQVIGSPLDNRYEKSKEGNVDYFWIIDTQNNEGLIIALRNGNDSMAGLEPAANAPKLTYLICAHEGYLPAVERGSEIHEFTKVANNIEAAASILQKATGVQFKTGQPSLSDMWQVIVESGYFKSLPAVAFAGGLFKPMRLELVASPVGPAQLSMSWNSEYYGGGTTGIKFTPGVPMRGVEYTTFVGTTATAGDYLVASPGNGKLAKVEAFDGGDYDLAFDALSFGPLEADAVAAPSVQPTQRTRSQTRPQDRK
jgi:hypothetical protein